MNIFNLNVSEYGIKKGDKVNPSYYTWDYCIEKKIPYIIIRPKTKYSNIDYDLFTVDNGLSFESGHSLIEHWWKIYEDYVVSSSLPKEKIPLRIIGVVTDNFTVFKKDQDAIINLLLKEIERYVNEYGIIDTERKKYYDKIKKANEFYEQREKYLEELSKANKK